MFTNENVCLNKLREVYTSYSNIGDRLETIKESADKVLKSYNSSTSVYGMFYPCDEFYRFFKYRGRLTKSETRFTFKYYFKNGKLLLTEKYSEHYDIITGEGDGNYTYLYSIIYLHYDNFIDAIIYHAKENKITGVWKVEFDNEDITRLMLSETLAKGKIESFHEFIFDKKYDKLRHRIYTSFKSYGIDKIIDKVDEFKVGYM